MKLFRSRLSLSLLLLTSAALSAQPVITAVLDGAALSANLAQGSVFVVKGTGLSAANEFFQADAPLYPTTFHNVSIVITSTGGGAARSMLMVYVYNISGVNQLAGVIPSNVAAGSYNLKVTNGAASSSGFIVNVVARKPGIVTADGSGTGIAQATLQGQAILQRNSNVGKIGVFDTRPAHPNDVMTLWGTGLGADQLADTGGSMGDQTAAGSIRVVLNGNDITPSYAGRSTGYPGLDQVNFSIPAGVALGCSNTVQVRAGGVLSNLTTIATAAAGNDLCPAAPGNNTDACPARATAGSTNTSQSQSEIEEWIASGQFCTGAFSIAREVSYTADYTAAGNPVLITRKDYSGAEFVKQTGSDLAARLRNTSLTPGFQLPAPGVCNIYQNTPNPFPNINYLYLDGGTPLTVQGPNGSKNLPRSTNFAGTFGYSVTTGAGVAGNWMDPGSYKFTGPGSSTVGSFNVNITVPTEFVVTNAAALQSPVVRSSGLTVTWTGGDTGELVFITGSSFTAVGTSTTGATFQCYESGTAGRFTVPVSVLQQLPASGTYPGLSIPLSGSIGVSSIAKAIRGQAAGIDYFTLTSSYNYNFNPLYQ